MPLFFAVTPSTLTRVLARRSIPAPTNPLTEPFLTTMTSRRLPHP
jgi:hypothetical protein